MLYEALRFFGRLLEVNNEFIMFTVPKMKDSNTVWTYFVSFHSRDNELTDSKCTVMKLKCKSYGHIQFKARISIQFLRMYLGDILFCVCLNFHKLPA